MTRTRTGAEHVLLAICLLLASARLAVAEIAAASDHATATAATGVVGGVPATLEIANRPIITFRASVHGLDPATRAQAVKDRIEARIAAGGDLAVTTAEIPEGAAVFVGGQGVFRVLREDLDPDDPSTPPVVAGHAARHLRLALAEIAEASETSVLLRAAVKAMAATTLLAALLFALFRLRRWIYARLEPLLERQGSELGPRWARHAITGSTLASVVRVPIRVFVWLVALLLLYEYLGYALRLFPYTRPWGETLQSNLVNALGHFGAGVLRALPGLLFVILIFLLARVIVRLVHAFFAAVQSRRVELGWVDETTARPTEKLATVVIWLFAIVAAYPYIPGSGSEAFKGVGVFVGLMLSIGSSGIVNQAVSGLMLMYTRSLRPGDFVRIGEHEGSVTSVGFLVTRLETIRNEEISIPNSVIAGATTRNFSRLAKEQNLFVSTQVTIGYDTPWRQVHAMLLAAAARTRGVTEPSRARVLQSALHDFYVEYTLVVPVTEPRRRAVILGELHEHIQDTFNEHGVQIMSPHYEEDPREAKVVPPEDWYRTPAVRESGRDDGQAPLPMAPAPPGVVTVESRE